LSPWFIISLDLLAITVTAIAAYLWWRASGTRLRRIDKKEEVDFHDLNRIIVSMNRSQILNSRAAIASAASALLIAMRFAAGMLQ
jgi:hypothetical protein